MKTTFALLMVLTLMLGVVATPAFAWAGGRPVATPLDRQWDRWGRTGHRDHDDFRGHERFGDHRGSVIIPGSPVVVAPGAVWVPGFWAWNGFGWVWVPPRWVY